MDLECNYYFGYGMNTNPDEMAHRCPNAKPLGLATLKSYRFRFATHADIVPDTEFEVHGVLWHITPKCIDSLDTLEGYPYYYDRKIVTVECNGVNREAWVYYMQMGNKCALPSPNYWNTLIQGYNHFKVPVNQMMFAVSPLLTLNTISDTLYSS
jgi:gamma-glutamylcyclotransferase (GGCT)/AIG2-like uncharacterized protein YtfP